jgi:asparagine synthase (glutamine-hydrolysing)
MSAIRVQKWFSSRREWHSNELADCVMDHAGVILFGPAAGNGSQFVDALSKLHEPAEICGFFRQLNGFFALVCQFPWGVVAAVDRVRSVPLFYGHDSQGVLWLSDDALWVKTHVDIAETPLDTDTLPPGIEFASAGYVTGPDTLHPRVKQLQAGEILLAYLGEGGSTDPAVSAMTTVRYYQWRHSDEPLAEGMDELRLALDEVVCKSFENLVRMACGRTIVVPLSGGYDSRLVVLMLKKVGYPNVLAFTYGMTGNRESAVSERVAKDLGIPWLMVPYDQVVWRDWFRSADRVRYFDFAHQLASLPHIQDLPAVGSLLSSGSVPDDAVFVPGHTGDFISGGHIPLDIDRLRPRVQSIEREILSRHYALWDWGQNSSGVQEAMLSRIRQRIRSMVTEPLDSAGLASVMEEWNWQERQAKFIVNSVRAYELWGCSWWLPLWDSAMLDFWARVPLEWRLGQRLYISHVLDMDARMRKLARPADSLGSLRGPTLRSRVRSSCARQMLSLSPVKAVRRIKRCLGYREEFRSHPLAWYGIMGEKVFREYYPQAVSINSFLTKFILGDIAF